MIVSRRILTVVIAITVILVSGFLGHPTHASTSYNSTPNTALGIDYNSDYNHGQTLGEYGSSTGFDFVAPSTQQTANFYVGVMAHTILWGSENGAGVRNLHITMMGIYPDGSRIDGLHMVADQPIEGPNGASTTADPFMSIIKVALGIAFTAYEIPSGILDLSTYSQSTPPEYGRESYDVFADWTCAPNPCLNQLGDSFLFQDASLKDSFHLNVDPNKQGTYFLQFIYHVDFQYCSRTGQYKGQTLCDGWSDSSPDYIDNILYCYVTCSSNGAGFVSQTPNGGAQTSQLFTPSQTSYLDSQLSTSTFGSADPIYVGTYQKTQDALVGFSLPSIPANSIITSANLQVYVSQVNPVPFFGSGGLVCNGPHNPGNSIPCQILASQISATWDSNKVTWNNPPTTTGSQKTLFFPATGNFYVDITSLVQAGYTNNNFYGIELTANTTETWQLAIMSGLQQSQAPMLNINYITYTSPPSTMCTGQTAPVAITMVDSAADSNGNVVSLSNWYPASSGIANPFVLESENPEGNTIWGASSIALPQTVLYGQYATFSFNAVAPLVPGTYNFQWRMAQQTQSGPVSFGDYSPNLVVNVQPCGDFGISASSVTTNTGQTGTSTITLTSLSGFAGQISLSDSVPAGLACNPINPASLTLPPSPATATLICSSNTAKAYQVTVTGKIGTLTHSTTLTVTVLPPPDFTISASPTSINVFASAPGTSTITIASQNGFSGNVVLSASPISGFAETFSPGTVSVPSGGTSTSTLTVSVSGSPNAGTYQITVTGSSGSLSHPRTISLSYPGDFSISASPASNCQIPGSQTFSQIGVYSLNGFSSSVSLSASVSPTITGGPSTSLTPTSVTPPSGGSAISTLYVTAGTATGTFTVTVTGTFASLSHSTSVTISVVSPSCGGGGGGGGSVAAGTLITLADGTQVPVQSLRVGMQLLSYNMTTHQYVTTTITRFVTVMTHNQMVISTATGKPLIVDQNPAQKLYVKLPDGTVTLMSVTDLKVGYDLFDAISQTWVPITDIHYENGGNHLMYDIYPTAPGNYIANGYLDPWKT